MAVEQRVGGGGEEEDQFPIGMRVLAVDDDPICLMLLETLLRRCQYKVTTTSQAIAALRMLRERKDDFDLVISDVHMPDMDGFKLLEHVGLEMDLPVIMLSAHSDPQLVMKGITHGACDYLLKPVRMEELKNIWQHVIRRISDTKDHKVGDKAQHGNDEGEPDHKLNKKRKDQMEDEEDDSDDNEAENEDSKTQKKARVVWSVELHGQFVAAVNQLGLDKAIPKRILELMHVENLTRENVASHLQKYRLYLKRINNVADQQALVDGSYLHMGSFDGFGPPRLAGPSHFHNAALRGLPNGGMLRRLDSPTGLAVHDLPSPGAARFNHVQAPGHLTDDQRYFQHNILQGTPISVGLDDDTNHIAPRARDLPRVAESPITFPASNGFSGEKIVAGSSNIPFLGVSNKLPPLEVRPQMATLDPRIGKPYPFTASWESGGQCHDNWSGNVQSTGIQLNSFALRDSFEKAALPRCDVRDGISTASSQKMNVPNNVPSIFSLPPRLQDSRVDLPCQLNSIGCNTAQTIDYIPQLENNKLDSVSNLACVQNSTSCGFPMNQTSTHLAHSWSPNELLQRRTSGSSSAAQSNLVDRLLVNLDNVRDLAADPRARPSNGCTLGQQCLQGNYDGSSGSLEDLVGAMVKQDRAW